MRFFAALIALCVASPAFSHPRHLHNLYHPNRPQIVVREFSGGGGLIGRARAYNGLTASQIGLHRHSQWCAAFLRFIGVGGKVDDRAISFLHLRHVAPQPGVIAVYPHHVGIVTGFEGRYPVLISGNSYGRRVYEGTYPRTPIAYVMAD